MKLAVILLALFLAACGGGSGAQQPHPPPGMPTWLFGYFGTADNQIAETAPQVSFVHVMDWGDWDTPAGRQAITYRVIQQMQEARARGVNSIILATGYVTLTSSCQFRGTTDLAALKYQLDALDLSRMVIAFYPQDEPDVHGCTDATMTAMYQATKAAWPGPAVAVVYGSQGTPGIAAADWIGHDDYGAGARALDELPKIRADQRYILIPGGSDPWRTDPSPFKTFADGHSQVAIVLPFVYFDRVDEQGQKRAGIRSNGLAAAYQAVGCSATHRC